MPTALATSPLSVSVVVPVYNSEPLLRDLVERVSRALRGTVPVFELVLVNDGSADASWRVITELGEAYPWVRGISLMRNYGQHNALLCGIRAARYELIVTMDDDLQHPPEEIPHLLEKLAEGHDVVYGTPREERHTLRRAIASRLTKVALQSAMGADIARKVSAFRAFRGRLREAFATYGGPFVSIDVLLTWGTTRFATTAVRHDPRTAGVSHYTFRKLLTHALNMMTGVALGIIGEYLARIHFRMMERPSYTVQLTTPESLSSAENSTPVKPRPTYVDEKIVLREMRTRKQEQRTGP